MAYVNYVLLGKFSSSKVSFFLILSTTSLIVSTKLNYQILNVLHELHYSQRDISITLIEVWKLWKRFEPVWKRLQPECSKYHVVNNVICVVILANFYV